jgi:hypothetical protein
MTIMATAIPNAATEDDVAVDAGKDPVDVVREKNGQKRDGL